MRFRAAHKKVLVDLAALTQQTLQLPHCSKLEEAAQRDYLSRCLQSTEKKVLELTSKVRGCLFLREARFLEEFSLETEASLKIINERLGLLCEQPSPK